MSPARPAARWRLLAAALTDAVLGALLWALASVCLLLREHGPLPIDDLAQRLAGQLHRRSVRRAIDQLLLFGVISPRGDAFGLRHPRERRPGADKSF